MLAEIYACLFLPTFHTLFEPFPLDILLSLVSDVFFNYFFIIAFYCNVAAYEKFRGPLGNVRKGVLVCLTAVVLT